MQRQAHHLEFAADVVVAGPVEEVVRAGMGGVERAVDLGGLLVAVDRPDVFDVHHRQQEPLAVPQGHRLPGLEAAGLDLPDVQADRDGPQDPVFQPHAVQNRFVVGAGHEPLKR